MTHPIDDFAVDEFGRLYLCNEKGEPFSGPYDTLDEAEAALADIEESDEERDDD